MNLFFVFFSSETRGGGTDAFVRYKYHATQKFMSIARFEISAMSKNILPISFYDDFLTKSARERKPTILSDLIHLDADPNMISLLMGKPDPDTSPFTSLTFTARPPGDLSKEVSYNIVGKYLQDGLQYGNPAGMKNLLQWFYGLQEISHGRVQGEGWKINVGSGAWDLLYKAMFSMISEGDVVLVEHPTYSGMVTIFNTLKAKQIGIAADSQGILTEPLRKILDEWPPSNPKPKLLYTVPFGSNPAGINTSLERRREILALARQYNFLIIEDDPNFHVYYGEAPRCPSYFALEAEQPEMGRVLRFDTMSKVVSAGIRIGLVSGPEPLVDAINFCTANSNIHPSCLSQTIAYALLSSWGYDGFALHGQNVAEFYRKQRDVFQNALEKYLSGLAVWETPDSGVFFWFKPLIHDDPDNEVNSTNTISARALERGVLMVPGTPFLADNARTGYIRVSFSCISEDQVHDALARLREVILEARQGARTS